MTACWVHACLPRWERVFWGAVLAAGGLRGGGRTGWDRLLVVFAQGRGRNFTGRDQQQLGGLGQGLDERGGRAAKPGEGP